VVAVACVLAALALPALLARATGGQPPWNRAKLAALAPAATVPAVAAAVLAALAVWWLALIVAVPAVILISWQLPARRPAAAGSAEGAVTVRVMTLNAEGGRADAQAAVAAVRAGQVDVLAVQELTPELVRRLDDSGLGQLLPSRSVEPHFGSNGTGLWSRFPMTALPPLLGLRAATPRIRIEPVPGRQVTVTAVHPMAPMKGQERRWQAELSQIQAALTDVAGAQVVTGDFNASRDHRPFRDLLDSGFADCADLARRRPWPGFTWPRSRLIPSVMRLDHVLVSADRVVSVPQARILRIPGTDHRAVLAVVELDACAGLAAQPKALR
jgi:endonuclease/exonuclease/phosphatase (EEP) superfamily protein YafD